VSPVVASPLAHVGLMRVSTWCETPSFFSARKAKGEPFLLIYLGGRIMLFCSLLVLMTVLNVVDLYLTLRFIKKWGLELEANPLARWVYVKWGAKGMGVFKGLFSLGTVGLLVLASASFLALPGAVVGCLVMTWVVSKNLTMVQILDGLS